VELGGPQNWKEVRGVSLRTTEHSKGFEHLVMNVGLLLQEGESLNTEEEDLHYTFWVMKEGRHISYESKVVGDYRNTLIPRLMALS